MPPLETGPHQLRARRHIRHDMGFGLTLAADPAIVNPHHEVTEQIPPGLDPIEPPMIAAWLAGA